MQRFNVDPARWCCLIAFDRGRSYFSHFLYKCALRAGCRDELPASGHGLKAFEADIKSAICDEHLERYAWGMIRSGI